MPWPHIEALASLARFQRAQFSAQFPGWEWGAARAGNGELLQIPTTGEQLFRWLSAFALSDMCNDTARAAIVEALVEDAERVGAICCSVCLDKPGPGDIWYRYRRARGVRTYAEIDAPKPYRPPIRVYRDPDREAQRLLWECGEARRNLGIALGARVTSRQATRIQCPNCGRRSVWFYLDPISNRDRSARCSHRRCGYYSGLWELGRSHG